jgi:hypothetical protein
LGWGIFGADWKYDPRRKCIGLGGIFGADWKYDPRRRWIGLGGILNLGRIGNMIIADWKYESDYCVSECTSSRSSSSPIKESPLSSKWNFIHYDSSPLIHNQQHLTLSEAIPEKSGHVAVPAATNYLHHLSLNLPRY